MEASLDMNDNRITNLATPVNGSDAARLTDVLTVAPGTNVAAFLTTPSSANLAAALTDETGAGLAVFNNAPSLTAPVITGGSFTGGTDIAVADGGTGASNASDARTNLGLGIGTNVQAYSANLDEYAAVNPTAAGLALLDDADASAQRTTLGLGSIATQAASAVSITGGSITGITDLAVADGGTGASTTASARDNLGVPIYGTRALVEAATIPAEVKSLQTLGYTTAGSGGATYARLSLATITANSYPAASYFRSLDRFMPDGSTDATNGGYWFIADKSVAPEALGAVGDGTADDSVAMQAAMDVADEVHGSSSAIYSVTNIIHRSDKTFHGTCEIRQRTAGSPAWFFDATTTRIERAHLIGPPHFRGHASSTVECVRMQATSPAAILGSEVDIQGTGGYHTLKMVTTGANEAYGCKIKVLQHSSLNTGCILSGVYNVYDMFIGQAGNGLAYSDTGANSTFTRAVSDCGQHSTAQNSKWLEVTVEAWHGTGKDYALEFLGSNPSINNCCIINVPSASAPTAIGLNVGGSVFFAIRGLRIYGTDYPSYPIDLRNNLGGIIENAFMVGGFKLEQYHTAAEMQSLTFAGYCSTVSAYGARMFGTATYDPASLTDGAGVTTTVTVTGAVLGDFAEATFSLDLQGITMTAWVSAADTVSVRFQNETGGTIDLASGTILARARKT
jgi:hypothetical protein